MADSVLKIKGVSQIKHDLYSQPITLQNNTFNINNNIISVSGTSGEGIQRDTQTK